MANPNRVVGRAKVKIDGSLIPTAGNITLTSGGPKREGVPGDYVVGGFKESTVEAKLEFDVLATSSFDAVAFGKLDDSTVDILYDTGQHFVMRHAWAESAPDMGTSDGKAKCVLYSQPAEKIA
jgi:hypothetical protein